MPMFPKAIHVVQKKELYQGWWPEQFQGRSGGAFVMGDIAKTREFNFLELEGDYDLFGDGSVLVLSTPGHTLGHQSLKVKLASGHSMTMSQDAIWMQENLDGYPAGFELQHQGLHQLGEQAQIHAGPGRCSDLSWSRPRPIRGKRRPVV